MVASIPDFTRKLENQTILLVGGSGGVGLAVAHLLLQSGANVILSSSRQSKVDAVIRELRKAYAGLAAERIAGHSCDLSSPDVEQNIIHMFSKIGTIDHLVYMAGDRLPVVPLSEVTLEKWQKANQVRTISSLLVVKHAISHIPKTRQSSITLTSGSIHNRPIPGGWIMLAMIAAGIAGATRQLALDLAPIRVNAVAPGVMETGLWNDISVEEKRTSFEEMEKQLPTGKVGQAEDVVEAYGYLMRDGNVTGTVVDSNGGVFLQ